MSYLSDPLWQRLTGYSPDRPGDARPFSRKLAAEQGWPAPFTARAIEAYKRFVYLCMISPDGASPSPIVDAVWHLHLTYTLEYWSHFCREILQRDLHHHPSSGGGEEADKHRAWYAGTLALYRETFGEEAPVDLWPPTIRVIENGGAGQPPAAPLKSLALLLLPVLAIAVLYDQLNPFLLSGPHFLVFFALLTLSSFAAIEWHYSTLRDRLKTHLEDAGTTDGYELAYLTGGSSRLALLLIAEGIHQRVLIYQSDGFYRITNKRLAAIGSPLASLLADRATIRAEELEVAANSLADTYRRRHSGVEAAFRGRHTKYLLLVPAGLGAARLLQGWMNGRPIGYLSVMVIVMLVGAVLLLKSNSFQKNCARLIKAAPDQYIPHVTNYVTHGIIVTGLASLASYGAYAHLHRTFGREESGAGDGGGGSGGDGGGSGCGGGGCGGCGGS